MFVQLTILTLDGFFAQDWGYLDENPNLLPNEWSNTYSKCSGQRQSPINILPTQTSYNQSLQAIKYNWSCPSGVETWELKNTDLTFKISPKSDCSGSFVMSPDNSNYKLLQMHFHWRGSEHLFNNNKFSAELHMVHQSVNDPNKYAVLGFMFSLYQTEVDNSALVPIVNQIVNIKGVNNTATVTGFSLSSLIPFNVEYYFRYPGSLTTPTCDEVVEWFVIDNPVLEISEKQLVTFQRIRNSFGYPVLTNARPVQTLTTSRSVQRSFNSLAKFTERKNLKSASGYTEVTTSTGTHSLLSKLAVIGANLVILFC